MAKRLPYRGVPKQAFANLTALNVSVVVSWLSGDAPTGVFVEARVTPTWSDGGAAFQQEMGRAFNPYTDADVEWNFGESGVQIFTDPTKNMGAGGSKDMGLEQQGSVAAYLYETPGTYTISASAFCQKPDGSYIESAAQTTIKSCDIHAIEVRCFANATGDRYAYRPTGGTFRLSIDGGTTWTGRIAYDAVANAGNMDSPLGDGSPGNPWNSITHALEAVWGAGNFVVAGNAFYYLFPITIEFQGTYAGAPVTLTQIDTSLLTGPGAITSYCRKVQTGATAASFSATSWSGDVRYWDPTAPTDGDGTIGSPYNFTGLRPIAYLSGGNNRWARLKRGTTFNGWVESCNFGPTAKNLRLTDYGNANDPAPIVNYTGSGNFWQIKPTVWQGTPVNGQALPTDNVGSLLIMGIDLVSGPNMGYFTNVSESVTNFSLPDCYSVQNGRYFVAKVRATGPAMTYRHDCNGGRSVTGLLYWGIDDTINGSAGRICIHPTVRRWLGIFGAVFDEQVNLAINNRIHHTYFEAKRSWVVDCVSSRSMKVRYYLLNVDVPVREDGGEGGWVGMIRSVDMRNCNNGIELSNNDNGRYDDPRLLLYGKHHDVVLQDVIGAGVGSGISPIAHGDGIVVRDCRLWGCSNGYYTVGGQASGRCEFYRNLTYTPTDQSLYDVRSNRFYIADNITHADAKLANSGAVKVSTTQLYNAGSRVRRNQYYVPDAYLFANGTHRIFLVDSGSGYISENLVAWAARTNVSGESLANPGWTLPSQGNFTTGTPPPITYSISGPSTGLVGQGLAFTATPSRVSGETLTLLLTGATATGSPTTLAWSNDAATKSITITPSATGTLTVQLLRAGTPVATATATIGTTPPPPTITYTASAGSSSMAVGQSTTVTVTPSGTADETLAVEVVGTGSASVSSLAWAGSNTARTFTLTAGIGTTTARLKRGSVVVASVTITGTTASLDPRIRSRRAKLRLRRRLI